MLRNTAHLYVVVTVLCCSFCSTMTKKSIISSRTSLYLWYSGATLPRLFSLNTGISRQAGTLACLPISVFSIQKKPHWPDKHVVRGQRWMHNDSLNELASFAYHTHLPSCPSHTNTHVHSCFSASIMTRCPASESPSHTHTHTPENTVEREQVLNNPQSLVWYKACARRAFHACHTKKGCIRKQQIPHNTQAT